MPTVLRKALLALVYGLLVVPAGLIVRLVRDPLAPRPDPRATTYWIPTRG
ncbi:hypothetical protein [Streptomyces sp. NPDC015350]